LKRRPKILAVDSFVMDLIVRTARFPNQSVTVLGCGYGMASDGTEAVHGFYGQLKTGNVGIYISSSGETAEL
jgi:hypothetical protein